METTKGSPKSIMVFEFEHTDYFETERTPKEESSSRMLRGGDPRSEAETACLRLTDFRLPSWFRGPSCSCVVLMP